MLADYAALVATSFGVVVDPSLRGGSRGRSRPTTFTAPVQAAIDSLLYVDLRMRKEGLDLVLQQQVARPAAGSQ